MRFAVYTTKSAHPCRSVDEETVRHHIWTGGASLHLVDAPTPAKIVPRWKNRVKTSKEHPASMTINDDDVIAQAIKNKKTKSDCNKKKIVFDLPVFLKKILYMSTKEVPSLQKEGVNVRQCMVCADPSPGCFCLCAFCWTASTLGRKRHLCTFSSP